VNDNPSVELLNYRYGDSSHFGMSAPKWQLERGYIGQATSYRGELPVGDSLYAQWRVRASGQVVERTVDLARLLPADIRDHTVYFTIDDEQLYVFLVSPEKLKPNHCPIDPDARRNARRGKPLERVLSKFCFLKIVQLYPQP
jgi:hypothetical protein